METTRRFEDVAVVVAPIARVSEGLSGMQHCHS